MKDIKREACQEEDTNIENEKKNIYFLIAFFHVPLPILSRALNTLTINLNEVNVPLSLKEPNQFLSLPDCVQTDLTQIER